MRTRSRGYKRHGWGAIVLRDLCGLLCSVATAPRRPSRGMDWRQKQQSLWEGAGQSCETCHNQICHRKQEDIKKSGKSKVRASLIPEFLSSFSLYRRSFLTLYSQTDEDRRLKLCFSMETIARLIILQDTTVIRKKGRKRSKNVEQNFPVSLVSIPVAAKEFLKFSLLTQ